MLIKFKKLTARTLEHFNKRPVVYILLISLIVRLLYLLADHPLWWDSHVYIGMGKYILSVGQFGIWESFRPLVHPTLIGTLWKAGIDPIFGGKCLDLIFSLIAILLLFKISDKIFNRKIAIISSLIFSLTPVFIMHTGLILTEPLALTLGLLGIYISLDNKKKWSLFFSGISLGLAFLTKFTMGIFFAAILIGLLLKKEQMILKIKGLSLIFLGFALSIIPYMAFNYFRYPNLFEPFISGSWIVTTSIWLYGNGYTYYLRNFFLTNPLYLFFFPYLYYFFKEKEWRNNNKTTFVLISVLTLIYFTFFVPRKETRYLLIAIPFMAIAVSQSLRILHNRLKLAKRPVMWPQSFIVLIVLLLLVPMPANLNFEKAPDFKQEINGIIAENNITGTVLTSDPSFVSFLDHPITTLDGTEFAEIKYNASYGKYELLFINSCDLPCPPGDKGCVKEINDFLNKVELENKVEFSKKNKKCSYKIYLPK